MKKAITSIALFVLLTPAYPRTLEINKQGDVFVNTERYFVSFGDGAITMIHNKLTQETYTQGEHDAITRLKTSDGDVWAKHTQPK